LMVKERHRWVIYYDETLLMKMNRLREETAKKDNVTADDVPVSQVVRAITEEKYIEYVNKQNNSARITTLVEKEEITAETLAALADKEEATAEVLTTLVQEVRRLVKSIDRLTGEMKNVRPDDN